MPDIAGSRRKIEAPLFALVEQAKLDARGMPGEERKIYALTVVTGAWRLSTSRKQRHSASFTSQIVASGGSVSDSDCDRLWLAISSVCTTGLRVSLP